MDAERRGQLADDKFDPDPLAVSLVQAAASLPMFIFAIPAGALSDIVDRRKLLIAMQITVALLAAGFGCLVPFGWVTPNILISFLLLSATAAALITPSWQSIVPQLIPSRDYLQQAVALNSAGINVSRAVGPALAGLVIAAWGIAGPFWLNALTTLGVIAALIWWRPPKRDMNRNVPPERFLLAISAGFRYARHNPHLRATLIRALGFFLFASAYWALLPLVARKQVAGGPELYGVLLGAIGVGAVSATFAIPALKRRLNIDWLVGSGIIGTAAALILFALAHNAATALAASLVAGISWIVVLASLNVSAQMALPEWVRGRGLSIYGMAMFGSLTLGSIVWGKVAASIGIAPALVIAAASMLLLLPLLWRWKLQTAAKLDLTPSMSWPEPVLLQEVEANRGPVLVTVDYLIGQNDPKAFLDAVQKLGEERRRDGAFIWNIFEDPAQPGRFVEVFMLDFMARAFAPASARNERRPRAAGNRPPLPHRRDAEGHASDRGFGKSDAEFHVSTHYGNWSGRRESNPRMQLGKLPFCH